MVNLERLCMGCMNDNGGETVCPICSFTAGTANPADALPIRGRIKGRYIIGKVIESDGEGITYIGWDSSCDDIVNIREFFPTPISVRNENYSISPKEGNEYFFNTALMDFISLAKKLRDIKLSALAETVEILEYNSTAYIITKAVGSITLREFLLRNGGSLSFEQARPLFMPLISAISALHDEGIVHGGISPETILVGRDGKLRISGFSINALRKSDSPINSQIFPGYAAIEQYSGEESGVITNATDVYGFASTFFRVLVGSVLPEAKERITNDKMSVPTKIGETLPKAVLVALANALQILPENRTSSMEDFKLDIAPAIDATTSFIALKQQNTENKKVVGGVVSKKKKKNSSKKYALISAGITASIFLIVFLICYFFLGIGNNTNNDDNSNIPSEITSDVSSETSSLQSQYLLTVPDFVKEELSYIEICNKYPEYIFEISGKKYSDKSAGTVVGQSAPAGTDIAKGTTVYLTISLGSEEFEMPDLKGYTKEEALLLLYEKGFPYYNIEFFDIEDPSAQPGCVVKTAPSAGEKLKADTSKIDIFIRPKSSSSTETPSE